MRRILAFTTVMLLVAGTAFAQGDRSKTTTSTSIVTRKTQNTNATTGAKTGSSSNKKTVVPQAQPFPTRRPADKVELNPQPLPPGGKQKTSQNVSAGSKVSLNPQPLPPGGKQKTSQNVSAGSKVSLNPQPLPPKVQTSQKYNSNEKGKKVGAAGGAPQK
jgi:hypothetical protein